jgi:hypothetical protein
VHAISALPIARHIPVRNPDGTDTQGTNTQGTNTQGPDTHGPDTPGRDRPVPPTTTAGGQPRVTQTPVDEGLAPPARRTVAEILAAIRARDDGVCSADLDDMIEATKTAVVSDPVEPQVRRDRENLVQAQRCTLDLQPCLQKIDRPEVSWAPCPRHPSRRT